MILAILLLQFTQPLLSELVGKTLTLAWNDPMIWAALVALTVTIGLFSGSYPALFLSALKPSAVLKRNSNLKGKAGWLQKALVVFQFSLSILILISTVVVSRQTNFIQNTHLGYDRENLISVRVEGKLREEQSYLLLKQKLEQMPGVALVDREQ